MSRSRLFSFLALGVLVFALPGIGLAGNPSVDPYHKAAAGPKIKPRVVLPGPVLIPGASVLDVGFGDSSTFDTAAGSTLIWQSAGPIVSTYSSNGTGYVTAAPRLPAGSVILQVDVYGLVTGATTQDVSLEDSEAATGVLVPVAQQTTAAGPGVVQATMSFPGGVTLAPGHEWFATDFGANSTNSAFIGAIFQYSLPTAGLVPITPARVFDSRFVSFGGPIASGAHRTIDVKDAINPLTGVVTISDAILQGAKAVSFNVTVTHTVGAGYLALVPGAGTTVTASTLNWAGSGATVANGGLITLGSGAADRQITLVVVGTPGGSAQVIVDITGYYW